MLAVMKGRYSTAVTSLNTLKGQAPDPTRYGLLWLKHCSNPERMYFRYTFQKLGSEK